MRLTLERLQALKRQAGGAVAARPSGMGAALRLPDGFVPGGAATPLTSSRGTDVDAAQLRRLLRVRAPCPDRATSASDERSLPGEAIAPGLRLIQSRLPADPLPPRLCGAFDRREDIEPSRVLFFDTETTGLAGGTGTRAFMIGAAHWQDGTLHVRQLLIATLAAEAAMLAEFARWLTPGTVLASYNGKSYDAPLLRTRWRLARMADASAGLAHIDLLYPARRRYRGVWENCRLATIERRALGIVREDDLPGSQAPAAWLGYLRGGSARNLRRVAEHNRQDVVTLARLLLHLSG